MRKTSDKEKSSTAYEGGLSYEGSLLWALQRGVDTEWIGGLYFLLSIVNNNYYM